MNEQAELALPHSPGLLRRIADEFGTPVYIYDEARLRHIAEELLNFPNPFGLTPRFAMKACPSGPIVKLLSDWGLHIDASSGYEARRVMALGISPTQIRLTTQEHDPEFAELVEAGVLFTACSMRQLNEYGRRFPNSQVSLRVNPGLGSGQLNRLNTGGAASSFGVWHEDLGHVQELCEEYGLCVSTLHSHMGAGGDPDVWVQCARLVLAVAARFPEVTTVNLGGGFKVARMPYEESADLTRIGQRISVEFERFADSHGRKLHLEIEPGTFMFANSGVILAEVQDLTSTGEEGYSFIKLNTGMNDFVRPGMYGAQHPLWIVSADTEKRPLRDYIVVGHCCETGDILTPAPADPEALMPRRLPQAKIGDLFLIGGAGAYASGFSVKNYNSFPESPEVLVRESGELVLIRRRQTLEQITCNEVFR